MIYTYYKSGFFLDKKNPPSILFLDKSLVPQPKVYSPSSNWKFAHSLTRKNPSNGLFFH